MKTSRFTLITCFCMCFVFSLLAQQGGNDVNGKSVTLMAFGTADNEEEAIKIALRSAIEQTYGTFVSANTQIVNDNLIKDEIVSVASGNIENYSLISSEKDSDGKTSVSVKATVSIGKLVQFAQGKGSSAELAGGTFMMNVKIRELNKKNESEALSYMFSKILKMCELNILDYKITPGNPKLVEGTENLYYIPVKIGFYYNKNWANIKNEFLKTIQSLSLSETECRDYAKANMKTYKFSRDIVLRNNIFLHNISNENAFKNLQDKICISMCSFTIKDNLGNSSVPVKRTILGNPFGKEIDLGCSYPTCILHYEIKERKVFERGYTRNVQDYVMEIYGINPSLNNSSKEIYGENVHYNTFRTFDEFRVWKHDYRLSYTGNYRILYDNLPSRSDINTEIGYLTEYDSNEVFKQLFNPFLNYTIYLFYTGEELASLNKITIEPTNPLDIENETYRIE